GQPYKIAGLNRKEALDTNDPRPFARALKYVCTTLALPAPEVYLRPDQKEPVSHLVCVEKQTVTHCFLVGGPLINDKRPEREITFDLARRMAHLRPERVVRTVLTSPPQVAHLLDAAIAIGFGEAGGTAELQRTVAGMKKGLAPATLEQVAAF